MYTRKEVSLLTQKFWTAFGAYMSPVLSAEGEKINWVNYKTGVKYIRFTMQAGKENVIIAIELSHPDELLQEIHFNKLLQLKNIFYREAGEDWHWELLTKNEYGKAISRVFASLDNVTILNEADWPSIISFFKSRIILLDQFWSGYKYAFGQ